jgi:glycosyltransferase involved in cell wall biosynthesis
MRLLVITPTLGRSRFLANTVTSIASCGDRARHVLVCPVGVRADLARLFPQTTIVDDTGTGLYAAVNCGLRASRGEEIMTWLNDDDLFQPEGIASALARLDDDPRLDVIYGRVRLIGGQDEPLGWLPVSRRPADLTALLAQGIMPIAQPGTLFRRGLAERLGGLNDSFRLAGDLDFFARALLSGASFEFIDSVVASFRIHAGQLSKNKDVGVQENQRALAPLREVVLPRFGPKWRFRKDNWTTYLDRFRRHGWMRMETLYQQQ